MMAISSLVGTSKGDQVARRRAAFSWAMPPVFQLVAVLNIRQRLRVEEANLLPSGVLAAVVVTGSVGHADKL